MPDVSEPSVCPNVPNPVGLSRLDEIEANAHAGDLLSIADIVDVVNECRRSKSQLASLAAEVERYKAALNESQRKLKEIVCTEPPDDGVVLLSNDGPTVAGLGVSCYRASNLTTRSGCGRE